MRSSSATGARRRMMERSRARNRKPDREEDSIATEAKRHHEHLPIPGERIHRVHWVHTDRFVVAVEVEMVIPPDDPSEPCYESETVELLRQIKEHAEKQDLAWLKEKGKVYMALEAA